MNDWSIEGRDAKTLYPEPDFEEISDADRLIHDYVVYKRMALAAKRDRAERDGVVLDLSDEAVRTGALWHALLITYNRDVRAQTDATDRENAHLLLLSTLGHARAYAPRRVEWVERYRASMLKKAAEDSGWGEFVRYADLALAVLHGEQDYFALAWRDQVDARFACTTAQKRHLQQYAKGEVDDL
jgi:hypothetical protein